MTNSESYMDRSSSFYRNTSCSSIDDDKWQKELKMHEDFMPSELKISFYDVMVLYSENNRADARKFCDHLKNDIKLNNDKCVNAALYDEFVHQAGPRFKLLEIAIKRSTYIFFFMTKEFCEDTWIELSREACLTDSLEQNKWCVVPVYTEDPKYSNYNIPVTLRCLKGIHYYRNDWSYKEGVLGLIKTGLPQRFEKERKQKELQDSWIQKYKRENMEKMETQQEMEQKIKGKDVNEGLQDIGLFSLNPVVDGMHPESDDQSQDTQMTPLNQSPSCWGTEVTVEEEEDQSLETKSKDHSMSVKKTEGNEHYSSLSEKDLASEMKNKDKDVHLWHKANGSYEKQVATVTPRLKVCKDRDGEKTDLDIVDRETNGDTGVRTIHETRETTSYETEQTLPKIVDRDIYEISPFRKWPYTDLIRYLAKGPATPLLAKASPIPPVTLSAVYLGQSSPTSAQCTESSKGTLSQDELD